MIYLKEKNKIHVLKNYYSSTSKLNNKESNTLEIKTALIRNYKKLEEHDPEVLAVIVGNILGHCS
jgi:hypothetical protein